MRSREDVVRDLVRLAKPVGQLRAELASYPWDTDEPLVTVGSNDVIQVLEHYLNGSLSSADVEEWANAIEMRDDIAMSDDAAKEAVFDLANPILQGVLTTEVAHRLKEKLATTHMS
jgi:hypothetical protein